MAVVNSNKEMCRPVSQCISREIWAWQQDTVNPISTATLTEIDWPQISGGCPYKVVNSQWVPTRPEAMTNERNVYWTLHIYRIHLYMTHFERQWKQQISRCQKPWTSVCYAIDLSDDELNAFSLIIWLRNRPMMNLLHSPQSFGLETVRWWIYCILPNRPNRLAWKPSLQFKTNLRISSLPK